MTHARILEKMGIADDMFQKFLFEDYFPDARTPNA